MSLPRALAVLPALALLLSACGLGGSEVDPDQVDSVAPPDVGACRQLTPDDVTQPSNATAVVDCSTPHTAETFAVGALPDRFEDASYDDPQLSRFAYRVCSREFQQFLGADESLVMRSVLSWAWFRPSEAAWKKGARWYRCDVVGGGEETEEYLTLPETTEGLLQDRPDEWLVCADGPTVSGAEKVPCSEKHTWRAVTTIKVGTAKDSYPGDRTVEVKSREFCSDSVGAWLNYPVDYEFGYTWFGEALWEAGNRRSICWAKTTE